MSSLATMRTNVLDTLGESGSGFIDSDEVDKWLNDALDRVSEGGLVLQAEDANTTTTADTANYALPTDALLLVSVFVGDEKLERISIAQWRQLKEGDAVPSSGVRMFAEWDGSVWLFPVPGTSGDTVRFYYFKRGDTLSADADTPEFAGTLHQILEDYALSRAYLKYRDRGMAAEHRAEWANGLALLRARYGPKFHQVVGSRIRVVR